MKKQLLLTMAIAFSMLAYAQKTTISGTVTDTNNQPLPTITVLEKGTTNGVVTDFDGYYSISVPHTATLVFSAMGYESQELTIPKGQTVLNVTLLDGTVQLDEIQLVGSRSPKRTATDTPVAVDIIDVADMSTQAGSIEINNILQYVAPSFNANKQSGSDGADHIDPASLRGLGPDQTLVLINGKRRHSSSLINVFGTRGRGNSGTDLNTIPASAIKRIEILRDGAAAQYGSDAIAGVINIVLKDNVEEVSGLISYGAYSTNAEGTFPLGTPNTDGNRLHTSKDGNALAEDQNFDGGSLKLGVNYGLKLKEEGFANFSLEYLDKNKTLRPSYDFRRGFGEAALNGINLFVNSKFPLNSSMDIYAFGGYNHRNTDAYAFTRNDGERVVTAIFPNGFTPRITSKVTDYSASVGLRKETESGWKMDLNNTLGRNRMHYTIKGTLNASLDTNSPTTFDAGGHSLLQNTTGIDVSKYMKDVLVGFNLAMGAEYRIEKYQIFAGEAGSYATFDTNGNIITNPAVQLAPTDPISGNARPGASQGFPGFSPANEIDETRSNFSIYVDGELDVTERFLIVAAARFENYSDFGNTLNGKLAARIKTSNNFNLRASVSSGFRAPSLVQIYYNLRFTDFQGGLASETLLAANNTAITKAFGIGELKEETALNGALGITWNIGNITATVDSYYIAIKDRIVLTGNFDASSLNLNVNEAQFFANGVDTHTLGVDMVFSWQKQFDNYRLSANFIGNINSMKIKEIHNKNLNKETFFGQRERAFLLASAPDHKFAFHMNMKHDRFGITAAINQFSKVKLIDFANNIDYYSPRTTIDANLEIPIQKNMSISLGGNNLLNTYPTAQTDGETESGGYWDAVQMGFAGAFYYGRLQFKF
ncbi:MAG: TonB-dependent receptor [Flavobacteriaceae bacterium]|nr:TonB-dependent receptor [Flavobacteriaceae bacterium]